MEVDLIVIDENSISGVRHEARILCLIILNDDGERQVILFFLDDVVVFLLLVNLDHVEVILERITEKFLNAHNCIWLFGDILVQLLLFILLYDVPHKEFHILSKDYGVCIDHSVRNSLLVYRKDIKTFVMTGSQQEA